MSIAATKIFATQPINILVGRCTADGAYDENPVYQVISDKFQNANIIIPPRKDAVDHVNNHKQRNHLTCIYGRISPAPYILVF